MAEGLRARGFDTIAAAPLGAFDATYLSGKTVLPAQVRMFRRNEIGSLLDEVNPDVVILQHWGIAADVPELTVPLAIDLAGPHLLERLYWGETDTAGNSTEKLAALRRADFVVCSGEYQRHYFYAWLALAGFDLRSTKIPVIPFSVPPASPAAPSCREPFSFVYGGAFLAWQDPARPIRWLLQEMDRAGKGKLYFHGGSHPMLDASGGKFAELQSTLAGHPRVQMRDMMPFDQLLTVYRGYSVALDLMARNPERELAYTTRTMVYLCCGLPVIHNDFSEIAGIVRRHECGWTVSPDDEPGFRRVVASILDGSPPLDRMAKGALAAAADHAWDRTIDPLAEFCAAPRMRPGKTVKLLALEAQALEVGTLRAERDALRAELDTLRGKLLMRLQRRLPGFANLAAPLLYIATWPLVLWLWLKLRPKAGPAR
jgi:hypothetical protein